MAGSHFYPCPRSTIEWCCSSDQKAIYLIDATNSKRFWLAGWLAVSFKNNSFTALKVKRQIVIRDILWYIQWKYLVGRAVC